MKKILSLLLLAIFLLPQTSASASASPIRLSADGLTVSMPVDVFRSREADIQKGEAATAYIGKLEAVIEELRNKIMVLESNIVQERRAADSFTRSEKRKAGTMGFIIGGIVTGILTR